VTGSGADGTRHAAGRAGGVPAATAMAANGPEAPAKSVRASVGSADRAWIRAAVAGENALLWR